jgi:hypothetical protein
MNEAPRGTARRSAEGALLVRELHDDKLGWKLVPPESEHCVFFGDQEIDPLWLEWPIIWCDVSRTGQHPPRSRALRLSISQVSVLPGPTMAGRGADDLPSGRVRRMRTRHRPHYRQPPLVPMRRR